MLTTDVVVVGAGPVGLFSVFALGRKGFRCVVVDALPYAGGQCSALYPEKPIYDIPAVPKVTGQGLTDLLLEQTAPLRPQYLFEQTVSEMTPTDNGWTVRTSQGRSVSCKAVVLAAGSGCFQPRKPDVANLERFESTSVLYSVSSLKFFEGKRVVVAGGGDSAADWLVQLSSVAKTVHAVLRRETFRASPDTEQTVRALVAQEKIVLHTKSQIADLHGEAPHLSAVTLHQEGARKTLEADVLLACFGLEASLQPLACLGVALDAKGLIPVDASSCLTHQLRCYAVGDAATYAGKVKLISIGFAEAEKAAHHLYASLYPEESKRFSYSTTTGAPQF